ncbi:hypothetical protein HYS82_01140 [Candidatus Amesbacteria bacterium]|nr:hypothetical protein [Candidatus Amesbacteria bacterium]MBI2587333.1 hypothetical protein [Candidatus Amesbacteria bacterium]
MITDNDVLKIRKALQPNFNAVSEGVANLEKRVDSGFSKVDRRFAKIDKRFTGIDTRINQIEKLILQKHNEIIHGVADIIERLEDILGMPEIKKRIGQLEKTLHA